MYLYSQYTGPAALDGLAQPRDTSDRGRSIDAITKALQLNPAGGYVKGSAARRALDLAIASVPVTAARELHDQLTAATGPLGRLFRLRLHRATRATLLAVLWAKHLEQQKVLNDANVALKEACERAKARHSERRVRLAEYERAVDKVCRLSGEDSDDCQKARFDLAQAQTRAADDFRKHQASCP
jgi:hypothetical protein